MAGEKNEFDKQDTALKQRFGDAYQQARNLRATLSGGKSLKGITLKDIVDMNQAIEDKSYEKQTETTRNPLVSEITRSNDDDEQNNKFRKNANFGMALGSLGKDLDRAILKQERDKRKGGLAALKFHETYDANKDAISTMFTDRKELKSRIDKLEMSPEHKANLLDAMVLLQQRKNFSNLSSIETESPAVLEKANQIITQMELNQKNTKDKDREQVRDKNETSAQFIEDMIDILRTLEDAPLVGLSEKQEEALKTALSAHRSQDKIDLARRELAMSVLKYSLLVAAVVTVVVLAVFFPEVILPLAIISMLASPASWTPVAAFFKAAGAAIAQAATLAGSGITQAATVTGSGITQTATVAE